MTVLEKVIRRFLPKRRHSAVVNEVIADALTYLDNNALVNLYDQIREIEKKKSPGVLIEAGCALGGSAIVIAAAKAKARLFYVYDVFDMIPPPTEKDGADVHARYEVIRSGSSKGIAGNKYYGYENDLLARVEENFKAYGLTVQENNIRLIKGLFQDTMVINEKVALAHIDGDWYESVITCLERIEPHLLHGGVLVIDDYYAWSGCKSAVDEYFSDKMDRYDFIKKARLHVVKK